MLFISTLKKKEDISIRRVYSFFFLFVCMFADFFEMSRPIQMIPLVSRRIRLPIKKVPWISRLP